MARAMEYFLCGRAAECLSGVQHTRGCRFLIYAKILFDSQGICVRKAVAEEEGLTIRAKCRVFGTRP